MANKTKKDNTNLILGICSAIVVVVLVVIIAIFATHGTGLNDDYFKSDDSKYVVTIDSEIFKDGTESQEYDPVKAYLVYTYSGEEITGMKTYIEYADANAAQKAFDAMKESGENMGDAKVDGKYIVVTNEAELYEGMTTKDVEQQIKAIETYEDATEDETDSNNEEETSEEE